jgi:hypothetical protein
VSGSINRTLFNSMGSNPLVSWRITRNISKKESLAFISEVFEASLRRLRIVLEVDTDDEYSVWLMDVGESEQLRQE